MEKSVKLLLLKAEEDSSINVDQDATYIICTCIHLHVEGFDRVQYVLRILSPTNHPIMYPLIFV